MLTWYELLNLTEDEIAQIDVAEVNLACAEGLPGSEYMDSEYCLAKIAEYTDLVAYETDRHFYRFDRNPEEYENSEAYFRMLVLNTILVQSCSVTYNEAKADESTFLMPEDTFIFGIFQGQGGGLYFDSSSSCFGCSKIGLPGPHSSRTTPSVPSLGRTESETN
jgi:hypothetical protein